MDTSRPGHPFESVDTLAEPVALIRALDIISRDPFYVSYKRRIAELLPVRSGGVYLDVGGGTGDDARRLTETTGASVVAVDFSRVMTSEAARRGVRSAVTADAVSLPFADKSFDGCWADRTFQHLADPDRALREMIRVTCPGGRLVTVDPDYDTQVMEFPDQDLARRVLRFRAERGLRNGSLAHRIPAIFAAHGLTGIDVEARTLVVRDPTALDNVFGLRTWGASAAAAEYLALGDVARWKTMYDETVAGGRFMWSVTFFLTAGVKSNEHPPRH
ncbi:MAG TPA: methyltransferase domain-containing protein [Acidobacteriota bacterium]|nr:methyltransferase domain-containing protein [Acidobacteriota bacterium]